VSRLAWMLSAICALLAVATGVLHALPGAVPDHGFTAWWTTNAAAALTIGAIGGLVAARRPDRAFGWLLLAQALGHGVCGVTREYGVRAVAHGSGLPGGAWALWLSNWTYADFIAILPIVLLFPDGRLRSRRWLPIAVVGAVACVLAWGEQALTPGSMMAYGGQYVANPVGWPAFAHLVAPLGWSPVFWTINVALLLGVASMLLRAREAAGHERRRIVLVALATALLTVEWTVESYTTYPLQPIQGAVVTVLLAVCVAVAVLRYGLYEVDLVVNRALVYGGVTVVLGGAYVAVVALTQLLVSGALASVAAAACVALLFAPVRDRLKRATDRFLFGDRDDPYAVIASLGERLDAPAVLPALAETVANTLKLPYVAIELEGSDAPAAERGILRGEPLVLPLAHGGAPIGRLTLGPRTPADPFTVAERRLFADIARQVAVAAHAVRLTEDLQHSRESLVTAREEERRRLRRDLHDGLGPTLAGVALQLESARTLLDRDPRAVDGLLERVVAETQAAIADVRRLVYDLRPPALDELGLVPALRQQAQRFPGLDVTVAADEPLARLPAAVEVAAYRIATEALTNVSRHASARTCTIRIALNGSLELEVSDDGSGMPAGWRPGVGVTSIRERAAELGGTCALGPAFGGGTRVLAKLPLPA
jgi:two-component system NarL family sensor kinase